MAGRAKHPCLKDCPDRTAECKRDCPRWAKYEAAKQEEYKERLIDSMISETEFNSNKKRTKRGCFLGSETKSGHTLR